MSDHDDLELIAQERTALAAEKAAVMKRLDELTASEQRLTMAEELIRALRIKRAPTSLVTLTAIATAHANAAATLTDAAKTEQGAEKAQKIETLIEDALREAGAVGATSQDIFAKVTAIREAKPESLASTLSRMVSKKAARREGKLYFLPAPH